MMEAPNSHHHAPIVEERLGGFLDAMDDVHTPVHGGTLHSTPVHHGATPLSAASLGSNALAGASMTPNALASQHVQSSPSISTPPHHPLPAPPELTYMSSEQAINAMMSFAREHGYGMSLKRSKPDGKDVAKTRYYYHCDRHGQYQPRGTIRERTSRSTGCMFQILVQKAPNSSVWNLKVKHPQHNHGPLVEKQPASARKKIKVHKIALIPGDGIGTELTEAAVSVIQRLSSATKKFEVQFETFEWGSEMYKQSGLFMPPDAIEKLRKFDAIFLGAVGVIDVPEHLSIWGLRIQLRQELKQFINIRPIRILRGINAPLRNIERTELDWVIVGENSEGEYSGQGGVTHPKSAFGVATEVTVFTRHATERIFRFAFETAKSRPRKKLTMVTKSNMQRWGMVFWDSIFAEIAKEYPDIEADIIQLDSMIERMTIHPQTLDTIVATNLHSDVIASLASTLSGSLGIVSSQNIDPTRQNPSTFEAIVPSRPDLAGKGLANPIGAFWAAAEMLRWLGEDVAADGLLRCFESVTEWNCKTRDLGGTNGTREVTHAVVQEIERTVR